MKKIAKKTTFLSMRSYKEYLLEQLRDPEEALAYLHAAVQDGDTSVLLLALGDVIEAHVEEIDSNG